MPPWPGERERLPLLLVGFAFLAASAIDWLLVPWGYPIAAAYGIPVLLAASLLGPRAVLAVALLTLGLSLSSDLVQRAPGLALLADTGSLGVIGVLAYRAARDRRAMQHARAQAEAARSNAESAGRRLALQYAAARALGEAQTLADAAGTIVPAICTDLDWSCGLLWTVHAETDTLTCEYAWTTPESPARPFVRSSQQSRFPRGVGLPGLVWDTGQPQWVSDMQQDGAFPRLAAAAGAGLHAGLGVPVTLGDQVLGVMEFFAPEVRPRNDLALALLASTGGQIGQFLKRRNAEQQTADVLARERAAHHRAEEAVRQRDRFLTTVTHDLRGPLTALLGSTQLLRRQVGRDELPRREDLLAGLDRIESVTRRMRRLVDGLLDLAVVQEGQAVPLRREPTDLVALVQRMVAERRLAEAGREIDVETSFETMVGEWDTQRLERVVDNLLGNALKYSPDASVVTVRLGADGASGQEVAVLQVQDRGIGIAAADLPQVFERFRRGGNVTGGTTGMGIGLAESREIVERHGGTIALESEPGAGTTCTVRLPFALAVSEGDARKSGTEAEPPASPP